MRVAVTGSSKATVNELRKLIPGIAQQNDSSAHIIINFSTEETAKGSYYTFNENLSVLNNDEKVENLLSSENINIIKSTSHKYRWKTKYRVEIFDLQVLRVLARYSRNKNFVSIKNITSKSAKQVCDIAVNTLYTLGLDFGIVTVCIAENDKKFVQSINNGEKLTSRSLELWSKWLRKQMRLWSKEVKFIFQPTAESWQPLKLGADPEFLLYDRFSRKWLIASDYFPKSGPVGTDARAIYYPRHGYPLAELRPNPAREPRQLVENLRRAMQTGIQYIPCHNVAWIAGSCPLKGFPKLILCKSDYTFL